jgi:hypothetical protein
MVAARNAGAGAGRHWVVGGATASALVLVVLANVAGSEAFVVRHNVARADDGARLDVEYLGTLSDDALPALVDELGGGAVAITDDFGYRGEAPRCDDGTTGVAALNLAVARATDARARICD